MRSRASLVVFAAGLSAVPAAAPARIAPRADAAAFERAVLRSVNAVRARHGLPVLRPRSVLARAARAHSAEQIRSGYASHDSPDGTPFDRRLQRYTRAWATGETIAWLPRSQRRQARTVVRMWLRSPTHRGVLLDRRFRRLGVGRRSGMLGGRRMTVVTANFASAR